MDHPNMAVFKQCAMSSVFGLALGMIGFLILDPSTGPSGVQRAASKFNAHPLATSGTRTIQESFRKPIPTIPSAEFLKEGKNAGDVPLNAVRNVRPGNVALAFDVAMRNANHTQAMSYMNNGHHHLTQPVLHDDSEPHSLLTSSRQTLQSLSQRLHIWWERTYQLSKSAAPIVPMYFYAGELPLAVTLGAGMLGGSVGVGVAYPLDTLKTKLQARESSGPTKNSLLVALDIVREEGIGGFYSGVSSTMIGQALIKGVVFFVYEWSKSTFDVGIWTLLLASCISGAVGSFVVTPVERVKCVMQANAVGQYSSPLRCTQELIKNDGIWGLFTRGLGATVLREVPAYAFYFVSYDLTREMLLSGGYVSPALIPLIGGAVAGAMAWLPVYPIDVVKTNIQVLDGADGDDGFVGTARKLYKTGGVWAFWDGIGPKLTRAVVNHAVCFYIVDYISNLPFWS